MCGYPRACMRRHGSNRPGSTPYPSRSCRKGDGIAADFGIITQCDAMSVPSGLRPCCRAMTSSSTWWSYSRARVTAVGPV